jgi:ferredoxin
MKVEYDRNACTGWFQCVQKWDALSMNVAEGKADFEGAEEDEDGLLVRDVPEDAEDAATEAAEACPVDAIVVYENGEQIVPEP